MCKTNFKDYIEVNCDKCGLTFYSSKNVTTHRCKCGFS